MIDAGEFLDGQKDLARLVERLDATSVQNSTIASQKNEAFSRQAFNRMFDGGITFGEAAGTMPWLNGPDAQKNLHSVKDDLAAQVAMFHHILDNWFAHGEPVAPAYPFRIAVILRKRKRNDLEAQFLRSYGRHFISHYYGKRSSHLAERMERVLGAETCENLWDASEFDERPTHLQGNVRKLSAFPRNWRPIKGSMTEYHFDFEFLCKRCGSRTIKVPDDPNEGDKVHCTSCKTLFGSLRHVREFCSWLAIEKMKEERIGAFS